MATWFWSNSHTFHTSETGFVGSYFTATEDTVLVNGYVDDTYLHQFYFNGSLSQSSQGSSSGDVLNNISIGSWYNTAENSDAVIYEILFFDRNLNIEKYKVNYYLSKKWELGDSVDSDGDGYLDSFEESINTSPIDSSSPSADFSDEVDTQIGESSELDSIEGNLALWLDASNINFSRNNGLNENDEINNWLDLSGNKNHAISDEGTSLYALNNNYPVVRFSNNSYKITNSSTLEFNHDYTIIYVMFGYSDGIILSKVKDGADKQFIISNQQYDYENNSGNFAWKWDDTGISTHIRSFNFLDGTISTSSFEFKENGTDVNLTTTGTFYEVDTVTNDLYIGKLGGSYTNSANLNGDFAEILIFNQSLTDDEITKINYYLSKKWGLEASVDSDGDSFTDSQEEAEGTSPLNPNDFPITIDFSDTVDSIVNYSTGLESVETTMTLWLDASNIDTTMNSTLNSGDAITRWIDLSGSGNNMSRSASDTNVSSTSSGTDTYITFNGDSLVGEITNPISDDQSYFVVIKNRSTDSLAGIITHDGFGGIYANGGSYYVIDGSGGSANNSSNTGSAPDEWGIIYADYETNSTSGTSIYFNGQIQENHTGTGATISAGNNVQIGGRTWDGYNNRLFLGDIAEIIVLSKKASDLEQLKLIITFQKNGDLKIQLIVMAMAF